ncbi:hypothetical protein LCGC14_0390550 [marine sediment metagenome]|uniref:Uncharacterized protein n=1 Tax=marine sediment metagenome TaxID=412755 RepID=A0A0F9SZV1_9ZZZZ
MIKKILILLIILLLGTSAFGQYVAPNENTVIVCGGLGTMANAAQLNGGGATKAAWDAGSPSDFINTNGGPITNDTGVTYDHTGNGEGERHLSKAGLGTGVTVGTLAYVSGTNITAGIYEITGVPDGDAILCANIVASDDNADSVVNVGGAIDTLQNVFDEVANNAALFSRYIYINGIVSDADGTIPVGVAIDIDVNVGTTTTMVIVVGYNVTLTAESQVVLQATADINAILSFSKAAGLYWLIRSIDFDAAGAGKANYCVLGVSSMDDYVALEDCIFRGAVDQSAISMLGDNWSVYNSDISGSGGGFVSGGTDGINSHVVGCSIHDNTGDGIHIEASGSQIINNIVYDNTGVGINLTTQITNTVVMGNTCYINDGDNMRIPADAYYGIVINNVCVGSTGGYGFNLNSHPSLEHIIFGYNLSAGNSSGHTDVSGTFANLGIGGNIASAQSADAIFETITDGSEDFTPETGSDLIDNALDAGTN